MKNFFFVIKCYYNIICYILYEYIETKYCHYHQYNLFFCVYHSFPPAHTLSEV